MSGATLDCAAKNLWMLYFGSYTPNPFQHTQKYLPMHEFSGSISITRFADGPIGVGYRRHGKSVEWARGTIPLPLSISRLRSGRFRGTSHFAVEDCFISSGVRESRALLEATRRARVRWEVKPSFAI